MTIYSINPVSPVECNGMSNEINCHGIQPIFLVQRCHRHPPQVISLVGLRIALVVLLHKPVYTGTTSDVINSTVP